MFLPHSSDKIEKIKLNSRCENQLILLMITDDKKCHYIAVKKSLCVVKRSNIMIK